MGMTWAVVKYVKGGDRFEEICNNKNEAIGIAETLNNKYERVAVVYAEYDAEEGLLSTEYDDVIEIKQ